MPNKQTTTVSIIALFAMLFIANPADAGFFDWIKNLFNEPLIPIEQTQRVSAQTPPSNCYGTYTERTSCENAGCAWYQNHYDGSHCDDTAHGQTTTAYPANTTGTPSCSSTPSLCTSEAECTAYNFSWSKTYNTCHSNSSMCPGDCAGPSTTTAIPTTTPTTTTGTPSTGSTTYPGDANSCPGFSYSKWDTTGKRYCQLNNEEKCEYNYPSYLDPTNYKKENCPVAMYRQYTWQFADGTATSSIINRNDSEYTAYIADIEKQCNKISKNNFSWKPRAGDGSPNNWKEFGIPDCSGAAPTTMPTTTTPTTQDTDAVRRAEEQRRIEEQRHQEEERRRTEEKQREEERLRKEKEDKLRMEAEQQKQQEEERLKKEEMIRREQEERMKKEEQRPPIFVDPQQIKQITRETKDQARELNRLLRQAKKLAGAENVVTKITTLLATIADTQNKVKSLRGEELQEFIQDYYDARFWDEVNGIRTSVELPKQLKDMERELTRTEKLLKQKTSQRLKTFGFNLDKMQADLNSTRAIIANVRQFLASGNPEDAQETMQEIWSGDLPHPGEIQGVLNQMRGMTDNLRRIKNKEIQALVLEVLQPVIEAVNDGDYREANQLVNEMQFEMQKIFAQLYRLSAKSRLSRDLQKRLQTLESRIEEKLLQGESVPMVKQAIPIQKFAP